MGVTRIAISRGWICAMNATVRLIVVAALASALSTLALWPTFANGRWYAPTVLAIVVVAATGLLARGARVPIALIAPVQAAALLLVTTWVVARGHLQFGFVPTAQTVDDLRRALGAGLQQANTFAPPVPVTPGIIAVTMVGVGVMALLVDVIAVTLRSPAVAGMPLLALYIVPAAVLRDGAPWWTFVPCAIGWLLILAADSRLSVLGWAPTPPAGPEGQAPPPARTGSAARLTGLIAIAVAVALPLLVPGLTEPLLGRSGSGSGAPASDGAITVNPLASLKRDFLDVGNRELLTVTSDDPVPQYLRMVALEHFDGTSWTPRAFEPTPETELNAGMPDGVAGLADPSALPRHSYTVRIGALAGPYLPMPAVAVRQTIGGGWFADPDTGTVFSRQFDSSRQVYTVDSVDVGAIDATTMRSQASRNGSASPPVYPPDDPRVTPSPQLESLARGITASTDNDFDAALALQEWFRSNFRYSTTVRSGSDTAYLDQFLTDRVGYCEQFAAAMALMARAVNIPARVAVGFAPGTPVGPGLWSVSTRDAHAWPELWMPGTGWTRFEPTPRSGDGSRVTAPAYTQSTNSPTPTASATATTPSRPSRTPRPVPDSAESSGSAGDTGGSGRWPLLGVLAALGVIASIPAAVRARRRARRLAPADPRQLGRGAWDELRATVLDYGRGWRASDTPRNTGAALVAGARISGGAADAVQRLVEDAEAAAYGDPRRLQPRPVERVRADLAAVRRGLSERSTFGQRWAARLIPASVMPNWASGGSEPLAASRTPAESGRTAQSAPELEVDRESVGPSSR